ncbi:D-alanyl-D-alanine carboxypeptidase [Vibrio coralliilyticus]|uniref:D-alanyl-D-alanine carboxypeptidase n=1 Tax=Vibrio coralliilyticus TaxID=190893 RepID=A0A7M2JYU5_9VIBR|nr:serine-type D-Ala-D-Ala carboxypeptidase [Vibrio coralliilyticus]KJY75405.1 D-alanyl-D-alanine carboxypeptidase [Vibrio coralliilyticus]QOU29197.1 serine-type D-Ala-D-Ala carboxypeptidase [Vibrio coralliilyticus]
MQLSKLFQLFFISLFSLSAFAYAPVDQLPDGSRAALLVESLDQQNSLLDTHNSDQYFPPASTLKLVTALAAKLELGDNFRFETQLEQIGKDVVIHFSGDPTLATEDLKQLFVVAKRNGLSRIDGDIWLDNSAFTGYDRAVGWPWDILGVCYSAPATAISLDGNCVQASIYTQEDGNTRVYVPEHFPVYVTTQASSVSKDQQESTQCDLELISSPDNHYQLQGCLTERSKPLPLKFAVQDPELYTQRMLNSVLNQLNLPFSGTVRIGKPAHSTNKALLATHSSLPLTELLETMLKRSDNLIADNLTKTLGAKFYIQPGSFSNGTEAIKQIIFSNTGINLEATPMADGSGLSRNNRFTSQAMSKILRYIWLNDSTLKMIDLMPKSGESGTLKYRRSMRKDPIKGAFIAKSGSLYGSYNMAGFGLDSSGKPTTLFVQYVADYLPPKKKSDDKPTIAPITQFETLFYQDIVKFSQAIPKK